MKVIFLLTLVVTTILWIPTESQRPNGKRLVHRIVNNSMVCEGITDSDLDGDGKIDLMASER